MFRMPDHPADEGAGDLLDSAVHVPEHVIFRSFARETVALNLRTGKFHGLNASAGRMVEVVTRARCPRDAVDQLASEYGVARERIALDVEQLLRQLADRGLVEIDG
jgi:Coenzyme PQQ synthesis protein D (PqqD)